MSNSSRHFFSSPSSSGESMTLVSSLSYSSPPSSTLIPSPTLTLSSTSSPGPSQPSYSPYSPPAPSSSDSTTTQSFPVSTSDTIPSATSSPSSLTPSLLSPSPTESISQTDVFTTLTPLDATTGTPSSSPSRGFFGNRGAVAGTFTVISVVVILIFLVTFLCRRRYQRRKQRQARLRDAGIRPRLQICESLFVDDPFVCSGPLDSVVMVERPHRSEKHSVYSTTDEYTSEGMESGLITPGLTKRRFGVEDDISEKTEHPVDINPGFTTNYWNQGLNGPFDRQEYRQAPQSPPYDKSLATEGPSSVNPQSGAYPPFPNWQSQRVSQTPSSPSIYPATLSAAEDHYSVYQLPHPSAAYPESVTVPNPTYQPGATSGKHGSRRMAKPEAYTTPLNLEDDHGTLNIVQPELPADVGQLAARSSDSSPEEFPPSVRFDAEDTEYSW